VTDGVAASFHFQAPRTVAEETAHASEDRWAKRAAVAEAAKKRREEGIGVSPPGPLSHLPPGSRVIGVDPGTDNIMMTVEVLEDGSLRVLKLTKAQYYAESGMTAAAARSAVWNAQVEGEQLRINCYSVKTTNLAVLRMHVRTLALVHSSLWEQRTRPCMARQRLATWSGRAKTLDAFFKKLQGADPRRPYIAYGDASFAPGGHGKAPVPVKGAAKRCTLYFGRDHVAAVDEHRTSAISYDSRVPLSKVYEQKVGRDGQSRRWLVRGLRLCRSTAPGRPNGRSRLVDRDINAALNIRCVAMSAVLPACFERGSGSRVVYGASLILHPHNRLSRGPGHPAAAL